MDWIIKERVLHGRYESKEDIPEDMIKLADRYEGAIPGRVGWNIPFSFLRQQQDNKSVNLITTYGKEAEYLVIYPKHDLQTKRHELLHAKYAMDESYRETVQLVWDSLTIKDKERVRTILFQLHYPDDPYILLDEFQAYYYTEKPSFFGIVREKKKKKREERREKREERGEKTSKK